MTEPTLNILVAIPYCKGDVLEAVRANPNIRFLLDSGAFTAWKKGKEITLPEYQNFVSKMPFQPWKYFTLDVIGNSEKTKANYLELRKNGFDPIPIFTRGENLEELEFYYENSHIVALGGLVGTQGNKGFVKGLMEKIGKRDTHWLGFTSNDYIAHFKPFSCDSSSWAAAVQYATIKLYCGRGKWIALRKTDFMKKPSQEVLKQFEIYGEDPQRLGMVEEWKNSGTGKYLLEIITCKSWVRFQLDLERQLGVKFFLACACGWQVRQMTEAYHYWIKKGF